MPLRGVLLDFGGTLDSEGLHWSTQFDLAFAAAGLSIERGPLDRAFLTSDRELCAMRGIEALSYAAHVEAQARLMLIALGLAEAQASSVAAAFLQRARRHLRRSADLLAERRDRFRFGLVSNFTGNLPLILDETGLSGVLDTVVCSDKVGLRKPDPAIFQLALDELGLKAAETAMIGDSLPSDIAPAKQLGLTTLWIRGDRVFGQADERTADHVAADLQAALEICDRQSSRE